MGQNTTPPASDDVMLVYSKSEDGSGHHVLRRRKGAIEAGIIRPLESGKPIHGEVVNLQSRPESEALFDVKVQYATQKPAQESRSAAGPPRVATEKYRNGWESIWADRASSRMSN